MSESNGSEHLTPYAVGSGCFEFVTPDGKAYSVDYMEVHHEIESGWKEFQESRDEYARIRRFRDWLRAQTGLELTMGQADQVCHEAARRYLVVKKNQQSDFETIQTSPTSTDSAQVA